MSFPSNSVKIKLRIGLIAALFAFCLGILIAAWTALVPFFLGLLLAYLLAPIVNFLDAHAPNLLRRKGWARPLAILLVYLVGLGIIAGILAYFIPVVIEQARELGKAFPGYLEQLQELITYDFLDFLSQIPPEISKAVEINIAKVTDTLTEAIQKGLGGTIRTVWQTLSFVLGMVIVPFWMFHILNDDKKIRHGFCQVIPEPIREDVLCIATIIDDLLGAYLRGQLLLCLLVGAMATIALLALRVDLALVLGTIAGVFELIPVLGPYIGAAPAVLVAFLRKPITALWVALSFAAIQQIENIFLVPRISGNAVRFHPAAVMIILVIGSEVAGLWGLALSVPLAAMIRDVFHYLYLRTTERGVTPQMALENLRARSF